MENSPKKIGWKDPDMDPTKSLRRRQKSPKFLGQIEANSTYSGHRFWLLRTDTRTNHLILSPKLKQFVCCSGKVISFEDTQAIISHTGHNKPSFYVCGLMMYGDVCLGR